MTISLSLTIDLDPPIYAYLQDVAAITNQSIERLIQQSVSGNLPPRVSDTLPELQESLLSMQSLSVDELRQIAISQSSKQDQQRHTALLEKNADSSISSSERTELQTLRTAADKLMVRKAHAWSLLRWHGQPIPTLDEIPLD